MKNEPNQTLERSRLLVTPTAFAAGAPSNRLAQLARWAKNMKSTLLWLVAFLAAFACTAMCQERIFRVHTAGMAPAIPAGSLVKVILDESYRKKIERFDLVVFNQDFEGAGKTIQIKRVIALPGEKIEIRADAVLIDDVPIKLPASVSISGLIYKNPEWQARSTMLQRMPSDAVFVLGDNAGDSLDSRMLGPLKLSDIIGNCLGKLPELKKPNQAVEPTTMRVTDPANAGSAPRMVAAHL
jgi:signal peptidase I